MKELAQLAIFLISVTGFVFILACLAERHERNLTAGEEDS